MRFRFIKICISIELIKREGRSDAPKNDAPKEFSSEEKNYMEGEAKQRDQQIVLFTSFEKT